MKNKHSKQLSFFSPQITPHKNEHGGAHSIGRRRARRPLTIKEPLHITLRSDFAKGPRSLLKHRPHIMSVINKAKNRFRIKVYQLAICGNHLHLLVKGKNRIEIQNFFRVVAGHIAQKILREFPLREIESAVCAKKGCDKNKRKFWALLLYSRVVTWGKEFKIVSNYIKKNILEALGLIAYVPRSIKKGAVPMVKGQFKDRMRQDTS